MKIRRIKSMIVAVNDKGYRIGSSHHNSRISDEMVDKIREMREDLCMKYLEIALALNLTKSVVAKICQYERRAQTPYRWKRITKDVEENSTDE